MVPSLYLNTLNSLLCLQKYFDLIFLDPSLLTTCSLYYFFIHLLCSANDLYVFLYQPVIVYIITVIISPMETGYTQFYIFYLLITIHSHKHSFTSLENSGSDGNRIRNHGIRTIMYERTLTFPPPRPNIWNEKIFNVSLQQFILFLSK